MDLRLLDAIDYNACIAIIPARGGSKSVPKKNIRLIYNHPMIAYSIAVANLSELVQRVVISTDSEEIAQISRRYNAEVPFLRPMEYAQDDSPDIDFMKHAIKWFYDNEGSIPEYIVHLRPTTPIRDPKEIDNAVDLIRQDEEATSLRSGSICVHPPYKWFKKDGKYLSPLMSGMTCDEVNLPRQDFPEVYIPNGYVDIVKADFIIKNDLMHGDKMIGYKTDEIPDIDTEMDLKKINMYDNLKETIAILLDYLNNNIGSKY
jgi:N-acylneuraminate cytidylyltransferase